MTEKFIKNFAIFLIGVDLGIIWLLGGYFCYKFWLADELTAILKDFGIFLGLLIVTKLAAEISRQIYWSEHHKTRVPPYKSPYTARKNLGNKI